MQRLILLHRLADIDCIVRPSTLSKTELYHILENGATGVLVPHVSTVEQAEFLVDALKFPPVGQRGLDGAGIDNQFFLNGTEGYPEAANHETLIAVQIETVEALENVEEIAQVKGIDVLFIGPGDLSLRLECEFNWNEPQMKAAQERVAKAAQTAGIAWGRPSFAAEDIAELIRKGARFISRGSDLDAIAWSMTYRYKADFEKALAEIEGEEARSSSSQVRGESRVF